MQFCFKLCDFYVLNMNIHVCHLKIMFHSFEYLRYWIHVNIVHINHSTEFMWFLYEHMKIKFRMKFVQTYEV
jgi:hypothetical protein